MYGYRSYGTSAYGSISTFVEKTVFVVDTFDINVSLLSPTYETVEFTNALSIQATLLPPTVVKSNREIFIKVNDIDISDQVRFDSLTIKNNLFSDPNFANFVILNSQGKSYVPQAGDEIEITDTGTIIFAGLLINAEKSMIGFIEQYKLEFKDWTEEIGNIIIAESYTNETVEDIIADIFTNANLSEYDGTTNVSDTTNISFIAFDNISVTQCLDKLAQISEKNWYVDPEKNIYFFADGVVSAPFDIDDTSGNSLYSSLSISEDYTQIRNKITIKGKGIEAVTVEDATSQSNYGLREYYEVDDDITATNEATQKANGMLAAYKDPIKISTFITKKNGLYPGQQIDIQSDLRGINETLVIENVTFISETYNRFIYEVKATSQKLNDFYQLFTGNKTDITTSISDQGNLQDISFSAIDNETIQWSSGTIILSDGTTYSISANTSQSLTGDHVIYFDKNVSETTLQISTTFSDGIGNGKIPLAYATRNAVATKGADIFPIGFGGKMQIDGGVHITDRSIIADNIAANSITANEIAASTITANEMNVSQLSAITADLGTITAGTITGAIIQTATSGYRIKLNSSANKIQFLNDDTEKGYITIDASGDVYVNADDDVIFSVGETEKCGVYSGSFKPSTNLDYDLGATDKHWDHIYVRYVASQTFLQISSQQGIINSMNIGGGSDSWILYNNGGTALQVFSNNNLYVGNNCSAASFTDRTPHFTGNALEEIKKIKGKKDKKGKDVIDHDSLPSFIQKRVQKPSVDGNEISLEEEVLERDLGAAISVLLKAVNELDSRIDKLEIKQKK